VVERTATSTISVAGGVVQKLRGIGLAGSCMSFRPGVPVERRESGSACRGETEEEASRPLSSREQCNGSYALEAARH